MGEVSFTEEQIHAIKRAHAGDMFSLNAPAGSGKTATVKGMCDAMGGDPLYLVYNAAAKNDAKARFPRHVKVMTTSALAWREFPEYHDRMRPGAAQRVPARKTAQLAGITHPIDLDNDILIPPERIARMAVQAIDRYCYSADEKISKYHVWDSDLPPGFSEDQLDHLKNEVSVWAAKIWRQAQHPGSEHRFTMDYGFKRLVHSGKNFGHSAVLIDEAQDSNHATLRLLKNQKDSQLVIVGDPSQRIYQWRGAVDILREFDFPQLFLTQSFRFGPAIAEEAEKWLEHTGTGIRIKGLDSLHSRVSDHGVDEPDAILCRTNAAALEAAMTQLGQGRTTAVVGGTESLLSLAYAAAELYKGKGTSHPELIAFKDWSELMAYTNEPGGGDLKAMVQLINAHGVPGIVEACKSLVPETRPRWGREKNTWTEPEVVVSTAHKAKGREWNSVQVADDFSEPDDVEDPVTGETGPGPISRMDAMLHYVTVTRAQKELGRGSLDWIDRHPVVDKLAKTTA